MVTATLEQTLKAVASPSRAAVLIHMGVDPRPGGGGGCLLAIELRRRDPNLAIILYTGNLNARTPALDSLGSTIPIVADESLTSNLGVVLSVAVSVAERTQEARCVLSRLAKRAASSAPSDFPADFRIVQFELAIDKGVVVLALQSRPTREEAAEAIGLRVRDLDRKIEQHDLRFAHGRPADLARVPRMAWVDCVAPTPEMSSACQAEGVELVHVVPGDLSTRRLEPADLSSAVVNVQHPAGVVDAWKLAHSPLDVAWVMRGPTTIPLDILLSALSLPRAPDLEDGDLRDVTLTLARVGVARCQVARVDLPRGHVPTRPSHALPNLNRLIERVTDGIVLAAEVARATHKEAASLVGLEPRTFGYRLAHARQRRERDRPDPGL